MNRQVDIKALVSHIVRGDGLDKCRICMRDTSEGQVFLGDTVMMDGDRPVTLSELLELITGIEVPLDEDLPAGLCTVCAEKALEAADFRSLCRQAASRWDSSIQLLLNIPLANKCRKNMFVIMDDEQITIVNDSINTLESPKASNKADVVKRKQKYVKHSCQCPDCGKRFAYPQLLYMHLKESSELKRACYICAQIMSRSDLVIHLNVVHSKEVYDCKKCPALLFSHKFYTRHMAQAHISGAYSCGDCGKTFKTRHAFNAHIIVHVTKTCPVCDNVFRNRTCYLYHVKKCCNLDSTQEVHRTKNKITVEVQNKTSKKRTKVGLRGATDEECICDYCGKKYAGKKFVAAHIQIVHLKNTHRPCPYCGKFLAAAHMTEHLKKHESTSTHTCEYCGIALKTKLGYIQHIRLHTGEKPYACEHCGESFSASSRRSEHIRKIHKVVDMMRHHCELCSAKFTLPYKLRKHLATVHSKRDSETDSFHCKICTQKFSSWKGLTHHNRKHQMDTLKKDFKVYSTPVKDVID